MSKVTALCVTGFQVLETFTDFDAGAEALFEEIANITASNLVDELEQHGIKINITKLNIFADEYKEKDANLTDKDAMVIPFEVVEPCI